MKVKISFAAFLVGAAFLSLDAGGTGKTYEASWASLDKRPVPQWWREAKFGIFIHWGPYAVPAYAPTDAKRIDLCYSEWYCTRLSRNDAVFKAHNDRHHHGAPYGNFAADFTAENFDPAAWADLFKKAGAKYAVLTSKHHDGYALWPSAVTPHYNSTVIGSGRDLCGEFATAMRAAGLKSGFYFSLLEHTNPLYPKKKNRKILIPSADAMAIQDWSRKINHRQMKELVERYKADIIWPDGGWDWTSEEHCSTEFLSWLFNESSMKDSVVVNDRWGSDCRGHHGGHYTTEYGEGTDDMDGKSADYVHPWEECRGIGNSFGYNRYETPEHYMSARKCIETLIDVVSRGGNLLLNVGPMADGTIPPIMQDRLLAIGRWLQVNGEAIYGTTRWGRADVGLREKGLYFTHKGASVYLIFTRWPTADVFIPRLSGVKSVRFLGKDVPLDWTEENGGVRVRLPQVAVTDLPCEDAWTIAFETK